MEKIKAKVLACFFENTYTYWNPLQNGCCGIQEADCDFDKEYRNQLQKLFEFCSIIRRPTEYFTESHAASWIPQKRDVNFAAACGKISKISKCFNRGKQKLKSNFLSN